MPYRTGRTSPATFLLHTLLLLAVLTLCACGGTGSSGGGGGSTGTDCTGGFSTVPVSSPTAYSGGATTIFRSTSTAFSQPAPNLDSCALALHQTGDQAFDANFVSAGNVVHAGLGPIFNNHSCSACHANDGRGNPPDPGDPPNQLLVRISIPGTDSTTGGPVAAPGFGLQVQNFALIGVDPEADVDLVYADVPGTYPDTTAYTLRKPTYTLSNLYISLPGGYLISPRAPPPVFGRGLLEAITEATLQAIADGQPGQNANVHGKINYVWNPLTSQTEVGRFGLKANNASLLIQSAGAYQQDMGVTSFYLPTESSAGQAQDDGLSDDPEISQATVDATAFYTRTLAVPARRNLTDATALHGEDLFSQVGCAICHVAPITTGTLDGVPAVSNQTIYPYTDLLVHDMGTDLADDRPDFLASGSEWRTPPLWGIGLTGITNGSTNFLHDGRARSLEEAILWHGGEAADAQAAFKALSAPDRAALIAFLNSL